ncbi:MAG: polyphosphate kinase 2 family protein [Flavobacteriales bacterium]|nr:polyphosphate kinase 2 family protein [Flavobacteriales bacterium]
MPELLNDPAFVVAKQGAIDLAKYPTRLPGKAKKEELKEKVAEEREKIIKLQEKLYADDRHALLILFQAMDASGKDSCAKHVLSGVNPVGMRTWSFKAPNNEELAHDFLWRHVCALPERGVIGIHNRSHYEEVLAVRVHPEYLMGQKIPGIESVKDVDAAFWKRRFESIRNFEEHLTAQGIVLMKFHLRMGRDAQKERLMERLDDPSKNWKFSVDDIHERARWDDYMKAYEEAIGATAAPHAPWYMVPADEQWETRATVAQLVRERMEAMDLQPPQLTDKQKAGLVEARKLLAAE